MFLFKSHLKLIDLNIISNNPKSTPVNQKRVFLELAPSSLKLPASSFHDPAFQHNSVGQFHSGGSSDFAPLPVESSMCGPPVAPPLPVNWLFGV